MMLVQPHCIWPQVILGKQTLSTFPPTGLTPNSYTLMKEFEFA